MRTFNGLYLEAKRYTELGDIPSTQNPNTIGGVANINYDLISNVRKEYRNGIVVEIFETLIEVDNKYEIRKNDRVYINGVWLKVQEVNVTLPKNKEKQVKMWPNLLNELSVKRVVLK